MADPAARAAAYDIVAVRDEHLAAYRDLRLAALIDSPRAFASSYVDECAFDEDTWLDRLRRTPGWLAFDGRRPAGTVTLRHDPGGPADEVRLVGMWVASHDRGTGLADRLIRTAVEAAAALGYARVVLEVVDCNAPARRLYERHGFAVTGGRGVRAGDGTVTESTFVLDLSAPRT